MRLDAGTLDRWSAIFIKAGVSYDKADEMAVALYECLTNH